MDVNKIMIWNKKLRISVGSYKYAAHQLAHLIKSQVYHMTIFGRIIAHWHGNYDSTVKLINMSKLKFLGSQVAIYVLYSLKFLNTKIFVASYISLLFL